MQNSALVGPDCQRPPAHKTILNNHQQNQELTQLCDWLLPMLMNGQVTVGTTEHCISKPEIMSNELKRSEDSPHNPRHHQTKGKGIT